jgi:hypothetical protein
MGDSLDVSRKIDGLEFRGNSSSSCYDNNSHDEFQQDAAEGCIASIIAAVTLRLEV